MKKIFLLGMMAGMLASCHTQTDGYTIKGSLTGNADSGKVYLERSEYQAEPTVVDSTVVENGSFTFSGKVDRPGLYFVVIWRTRILHIREMLLRYRAFIMLPNVRAKPQR